MAAPVAIAHTHVHSVRLASGAEALVARVLAADGTAGFGFTLNLDAGVARDLAGWDALARRRNVPFCDLFGGRRREAVPLASDAEPALAPDWEALRRGLLENRTRLVRIDPFAWGSIESVHTAAASAAAFERAIVLLAPNGHPWEIAFCAALAATLPGNDVRIAVRGEAAQASVAAPRGPGIGIEWSLEPGFAALRWLDPG